MIKAPSLLSSYSLVWSGDPALALPVFVADPEKDEAANLEDAKAVHEERERMLRVARQTGQWQPLIRPGERPTVFTFRNLNWEDREWLSGEIRRRELAPLEVASRSFRLALVKIENLGSVQVGREEFDGRDMATTEVLNVLHEALGDDAASLVHEFAAHITDRARRQLDPL